MAIPIPDEVWESMIHVLTPDGVRRWWVTEHRLLNGVTPAFAWTVGRTADVQELMLDYRGGPST